MNEWDDADTTRYDDAEARAPGGHASFLWMVIYTDMITNLMIFFLMCYCLTWLSSDDRKIAASSFSQTFGGQKNGVNDTIKAIENEKQARKTAEDAAESRLRQQFSDVEANKERIKIILPSPVLFDSGSADLKPATFTALHELAETVRAIPNAIVVEGHTDNVPIHTAEYQSNWELSTARAFSVIRYFIDKEQIAPARLSAFGYGEFRPKSANDTPAHVAANRRIEISLIKTK